MSPLPPTHGLLSVRYGWGESLPSAVWGTKWLQAAEGKEKLRTEDPDLPESTAGPRECSRSCTRSPALTGWGQTGRGGKERTQKLRVAQRPRWPHTRLSFPNGGPAPRMHAAEEAHSAAFKIRRRAAVSQHGDCACHSRPATHGVAPANGLETQCETSDLHLPIWGALWPQKQNQKGSRRTARPTHSPPHTRVSVCTNATFCFVRSIDKSNFGV